MYHFYVFFSARCLPNIYIWPNKHINLIDIPIDHARWVKGITQKKVDTVFLKEEKRDAMQVQTIADDSVTKGSRLREQTQISVLRARL